MITMTCDICGKLIVGGGKVSTVRTPEVKVKLLDYNVSDIDDAAWTELDLCYPCSKYIRDKIYERGELTK